MDISIVLAAAAAVNRLVEFLKPYMRKLHYTESVQDGLLVLTALLAGVAVALMGNLSLFTGVANVPATAGLVLTGAVIGLGADFIHIVFDFLYGWRDRVVPPDNAPDPAAS